MRVPLRRLIALGASGALLLGAGAFVASQVGDVLDLRTEPSSAPAENPIAAAGADAVLPPSFTIDAPKNVRTDIAVAELHDAVAAVGDSGQSATLTVIGEGDGSDDSYALAGSTSALTITADTTAGAVRGVYDLANAARNGRSVFEHLGETVSSALPFRLVDLGAAGVPINEEAYAEGTDYSHNSLAFSDAILPNAPYVDEDALAADRLEFEAYVRHVVAEGYTAIAVPGLVEYLSFSEAGVYSDGDEHLARAEAMRESFGDMWEYASDLGLEVYFRTDMLALSTPLEEYFVDKFGSLDTENPEFWNVYTGALDELYTQLPFVDGVLIRIGEAGRVYDLEGWDYYSSLAVTSVESVRAMLTSFTAEAESAGKQVIFRTWSVGVGAVGDMHTDQDSYHAVLDGIYSPSLIVSTKYTLGDFYSHLPLNNTLEVGDQRRIIEFQSRREFENFGALPNDLGDLYSQAINHFIEANPKVEGIWTWTQDGGPWRAGPMTMELKAGFWQLYELNTVLAVDLARDPGADPGQITADWARRWFSTDAATVGAISDAMAESRATINDGLYIGPFAEKKVYALGLEPPPMMWIFEWDILTGDSAVLDIIYEISKDDLDEAIDGGDRAIASAKSELATIEATDAATWTDPALRESFIGTLEYQVNVFETLGSYRTMVLRHAEWLDTGSSEAYSAWESAAADYKVAATKHTEVYGGNVDYPAYNLTAANLGLERAERDLPMAWAARIALVLLAGWLIVGLFWRRLPGSAAARALLTAGTRPWRAPDVVADLNKANRALLLIVPIAAILLSRGIYTWFLAPAHLFVTSLAWVLFAVVLFVATIKRNAWPVIAAAGGAVLLRVVLLLAVLAPSGPGGYWFNFWTDPVQRALYITVAFALFVWVLVAAGWALAAQLGGRRSTGILLAAVGFVLVVIGSFIGAIGLEAALTVWNDQLALLPWGLSRILGLTVYLEIPQSTPWYAVGFGAVLLLVGAVLALPFRRRLAAT